MIIKMTVHDNDFTDTVEQFASKLMSKLLFFNESGFEELEKPEDIQRKIELIHHSMNIQSLMNSNNYENLNRTQRSVICREVKKHWKKYIYSPESRAEHETESEASTT